MSSIALSGNAAGAGVFTVAAPNSASSYTATLPAATTTLVGTDATQTLTNKTLGSGTVLPAGAVLQVVSAVKTDTFSMNSNTFTDITGYSVSITPTSASSKILVSINGGQFRYSPSGGQEMHERLYRSIGGGSYSIIIGDLIEIVIAPSNGILAIPHSFVYLDSPTIYPITLYKIKIY
jgi:hypothetical protein